MAGSARRVSSKARPSDDGPSVNLLSGVAVGPLTARFTFSAAVTAADFTAAWFFDVDDNQNGVTVTQVTTAIVEVLFDGPIFAGAEVVLTDQPSYVAPGGDVTLT